MSHLSMKQLSRTLDGSLESAELEQAREHLSGCIICQEHQERLVQHDSALRRLFGNAPDERVLEDVTRRSEAVATAILRGLPLPPLVTSLPLEDDDLEEDEADSSRPPSLGLERLDRFSPPASPGPATVGQDPTAASAQAANERPPPRDPSRATLRPTAGESSSVAPLAVTPRLDTEHVPPPAEKKPGSLVETYDAFNDFAYAGPVGGRLPPMLGRPQEQKEDSAEQPQPRKEYRHGGVRRETPSDPARENPVQRTERAAPEPRDEGFGVKRATEPAWSRMGLRPDPHKPGVYRDTLTGAAVSPPAAGARRPVSTPPSSGRSRTALIATLVTVGGI